MKSIVLILGIWFILGSPDKLWGTNLESKITQPILLEAWGLLKAGQTEKCLQKLSKYQPKPETNISYHFIYGRALEKSNQPFEALEHYRSAYLSAPPGELKDLTLLERADASFRIGHYIEARLAYGLFLSNFSKSNYVERANLGMGRSLTALNMVPKALPFYEKAGESSQAIFGRAVVLARLGRFKEAYDQFSKGISREKDAFLESEEFIFYYGDTLHRLGQDLEAVQYLNSEFKNPIMKKKAELSQGLIAKKAGKADEAKKYFESAIASSDRQTKQAALLQLAEVQINLGRKNEARHGFQEYLQKYSDGKDVENIILKLTRLEMEEARYEQAGKWLIKLGQSLSLKKETLSELEGILLKLKEKDPKQVVTLWRNLGKKFLDQSRETFLLTMAEALKGAGRPYLDLLQWLALNGTEKGKLQSRLAIIHYQVETGNLMAALAGLKLLNDHKGIGSSDEILRLKAKIFYARGEYGAAWDCLYSLKQAVLQDLPLMEETISSAGNRGKALQLFAKTIQRLGGNANSYIRLGDLLYEKGNTKEALLNYQKALEKDPLNEWGLFRVACLTSGDGAQQILGRIKNGNSLVSKLAEISLREKEVERKMGEIF